MKKFITLVLALMTGLALAACQSSAPAPAPSSSAAGGASSSAPAPAPKTFKLGIVIPSGDHGFTGESVAHAKAEADAQMKANPGLTITVKDGIDAAAQITSIENMLANDKPDMIMLWPMEGEALRSTAQTIIDAGVKLVVYDRLITDFKGLDAQIMGDNVAIGKGMGEYITKFFANDTTVNYLRFVGDSSTVTSQRSDGMDGVIDKAKFKQINETFVTNWSLETAQNQMEQWLNAKSKAEIESLSLIVTHDDEITVGLYNALDAYSGPAKLNVKLITSVGGREDCMQSAERTKTTAKLTTWYFSPSFIRESVRLSVAHLMGTQYNGTAKESGGIYLIPSFSISNAGNSDMDFASYRASDIFKERSSITVS